MGMTFNILSSLAMLVAWIGWAQYAAWRDRRLREFYRQRERLQYLLPTAHMRTKPDRYGRSWPVGL